MYLDVHAKLWEPSKPWAEMQRQDWNDLFMSAITADAPAAGSAIAGKPGKSETAEELAAKDAHTYVLKPVDGQLHYIRRGRNVRKDESLAIQEANVNLHAISLHVSRACPLWLPLCNSLWQALLPLRLLMSACEISCLPVQSSRPDVPRLYGGRTQMRCKSPSRLSRHAHETPATQTGDPASAGDQFQSLQKVSGEFATYAARAKHWHRRPKRPPMDKTSTVLWWKYAGTSVQGMLPTTMQWTDVQQVRIPATMPALVALAPGPKLVI